VGPLFGSICASALFLLLNTDALGSEKDLAAAEGVAMGDGGATTPREFDNEVFVADVPAKEAAQV
jgi:hypothetical protein